MNPWLKRGAAALIGVAGLAAAAVVVGAQLGERKAHRIVSVPVAGVPLRSDAAAVQRGRYLYKSRGCGDCHAADGSGSEFINDGKGMRVRAPNITPGPGGAVAAYAAADWDRTIRHGIKPDGRPLRAMPSQDHNRLTDADLAAVVAYVRQLPPAAAPGAQFELPVVVKALYAAGLVRDAAETIDHRLPPAQPVPEAVSAEHGAYVANACIGCHGARLSGGTIPGGPPDWPAAANLTPGKGSVLPRYPDAPSFVAMLRTGKRPDGSSVSPVMPFNALKEINDVDAQALYLHLKGLAPLATGAR
jgi:mono/diheme cytochrome c family protein